MRSLLSRVSSLPGDSFKDVHSASSFPLEGLILVTMLGIRQVVTMVDNVSLNRRLLAKVELGTQELRDREARYSALVEHSSDPITIVKKDATFSIRVRPSHGQLGWESSDLSERAI